jgi:hypothetical protein
MRRASAGRDTRTAYLLLAPTNVAEVAPDGRFARSLLVTVVFVAIVIPAQTVLGLVAALLLARTAPRPSPRPGRPPPARTPRRDEAGTATIPAPSGPKAFDPLLNEVFAARTPVVEGLQAAQDAGNAAMR